MKTSMSLSVIAMVVALLAFNRPVPTPIPPTMTTSTTQPSMDKLIADLTSSTKELSAAVAKLQEHLDRQQLGQQ